MIEFSKNNNDGPKETNNFIMPEACHSFEIWEIGVQQFLFKSTNNSTTTVIIFWFYNSKITGNAFKYTNVQVPIITDLCEFYGHSDI